MRLIYNSSLALLLLLQSVVYPVIPLVPLAHAQEATDSAVPASPSPSPLPSPSLEPSPSSTPSATPEPSPSPDPSATPSASPSATPSAQPSPDLSDVGLPEADPSPEPTVSQDPSPSPSSPAVAEGAGAASPAPSYELLTMIYELSYPFIGSHPVTYRFGQDAPHDLPVIGRLQALFGVTGHDGVDWALPVGTPVLAAAPGQVVQAGRGDYGLTVVVEHTFGRTYYGHLSQISVAPGDQVQVGSTLGLSGSTGVSTGPHLHFGFRPTDYDPGNGYHGLVDPLPYLTGQDLPQISVLGAQTHSSLIRQTFRATDSLVLPLADRSASYSLTNPRGAVTSLTPEFANYGTGELAIIPPPTPFIPGQYVLGITDGSGHQTNQDFTWGVLALNYHQSSYLPGEVATFDLAVLDGLGRMVCNADLTLEVTDPYGNTDTLSTHTGEIVVNPEVCHTTELTLVPDYQASYRLNGSGTYTLSLTAVTDQGSYTIEDQLEVTTSAPFVVERTSATRLYPIHNYPMTLRVTPRDDYQGTVTEIVPPEFAVEGATSWEVDWQAGQTYELTYTYDAPDESPALFALGPLTIGGWQESRPWQLAVDAVTRGASIGTWTTSATTTGPSGTAFAHTVNANTTLLLVAIGMDANESISVAPVWNGSEGLTLIHASTANANSGDQRVYTYGRVSPTATSNYITFTMTSDNHAYARAINYLGTVSSSVDAATNLVDETVNNSATTTTVLASGGSSGSTLFVNAVFEGGDGDPASNNASFAELADSATGTSTTGGDDAFYVADLIGGAPSGVTVDWNSTISDENAGHLIEILPAPTTITIQGTANGNNGASIRYAYNGTIQSDTSDTIGSGTWSIDNVTPPSAGQIITVWVDGVADANESTAVTEWSSSNVSDMVLNTNVLSLGSNQNTSLSLTELNNYDCTEDEDVMHQAASSHLKIQGDSCSGGGANSYSAEKLDILSSNTLTVSGSETLTTYDLTVTGTLTSGGNSIYNVEHDWAKTGTFTESSSTVNLTGAGGTTQTISGTNTFSTLSATGSSARTIKFPSSVTTTVSTSLTLTGASSQLLTLDPGSAATVWTISAPATTSVSYVSVSYSTNSGTAFCATNSTDGDNNNNWFISSGTTCSNSAYSFQRKTWFDGTRYWRSYHDIGDGRIEFEYSTDGDSWTEDTSARISTPTSDFSVWADNSEAYVAYKTSAVTGEDNLLTDSALVAYWKMNEGSWNTTPDEVVDSSGNANHGTAVADAITTTGKFGNGGTFDGTGDQVNVDDHATLRPGTASWTMTGWFNPNNADQSTLPFFKFNGGSSTGFGLGVAGSIDGGTSGKQISAFLMSSSGADLRGVITDADVVDGSWHHIAVVFNQGANSATIYVDGSSVAVTTDFQGSWPNVNNTDALTVGTAGYTGLLDDMRLYNRALSAEEAATLGQPGYDIEVRSAASYPDEGFSWGNEAVALNGASSSVAMQYPTITQDANSRIWVSGSRYDTSTPAYAQYAVRSTGISDVSLWDTSTSLDSSTNANRYGVIVPRTTTSAYAVWIDGAAIEGKNYNGSAWDGSPTAIDTGLTGLADTFSAVGDDSTGDIYLVFVDDETTDQVSSRKFDGTWDSAGGVADTGSAAHSYPSVTFDTTNDDVYAFWIDTSGNDIYYSVCSAASDCDEDTDWSDDLAWQEDGNFTYISSNYSGAELIFAQWMDSSSLDWDEITLGGNTAPDSPASLAQKTTGDVTLSTGDWHNTTSIKFTATATDTDNPDTLQLCVEKDILGTGFSNTEDACGTGVAYSGSGVTVTVTIGSQTDASEYHWQARIKDAAGEYSAWVSYDVNAESARDYGLDSTAPTGGVVYDGTTPASDASFSTASLSELSGNWDSFNFDVAGAHASSAYDYSIGTSAGGTDIKDWTDNGTSTSVTATSLTLQTSQMYFVNVRAKDKAGNTGGTVSSNGQLVAPSISFAVSPATLTFSNLNPGNSYNDTELTTLTTSTNAYNGYIIRAFVTDYLRSQTGNFTIDDFTGGTYASPAAWGSSTGYGYTSDDTSIQGSDKFAGGTLYAPFSHTGPGDIVSDHTSTVTGSPISGEEFTLTHRVTASATQAAHDYSTTVVYTATAQY